jgi:hypothetical protein
MERPGSLVNDGNRVALFVHVGLQNIQSKNSWVKIEENNAPIVLENIA